MKPNFTTISQVLNQEVNIYTYRMTPSPEDLYQFGYLVTTTEYEEPQKNLLQGYFTMRIGDLPNIYEEYMAAFMDYIDNALAKPNTINDIELHDYLSDYIRQLLQMGAILHEGLNDTPEDIISILNAAAGKYHYDFSELIGSFDWEHESQTTLHWNLILNHIDL